MPQLILDPLEKAVASLDEVMAMEKNAIVRDSAIQRFEYTYELSYKMMERYLALAAPAGAGAKTAQTFKTVLRDAFDAGLIEDPEAWFRFRDAGNRTSHGYDESEANAVYAAIPAFLSEAKNLLARLKTLSQSL